ncbi:hypothetical protein BIY29_02340 [Brenneria alni]|uniref:Uncharacterized protein n=1 Tax=Brenneria alni TaxID=71656 RepID=A0A421DSU1_9GAMM|nr:hypothetical protein [Brenneria alni]RLM27498.1 hypothetical protein BIY29_02340 [Brenneria alni]
MLNSTKERMATLANDPNHLRRLMVLWPENHMIHQLAKAHLEALEKLMPFTPARGPKIPAMAPSVVLSVRETTDD